MSSKRSGPKGRVAVLSGTMERLRGLKDESLRERAAYAVLVPCGDVHTFGMGEPIDVAFAGKDGLVIESYRGIESGRRLRCRGACMAIERFADEGTWFEAGDSVFGFPISGGEEIEDGRRENGVVGRML